MPTSLLLKPDRLEAVYGWLEDHGGVQAQLWAWENNRRVALVAYSDGGEDAFGWSNWASKDRADPSELTTLFEQLELITDDATATKLNATFLGVFTVAQNSPPSTATSSA
jgi:hypothetical protein